MLTADQLRALADQVQERDDLVSRYDEAREAFQADPADEDKKAAYRELAEQLRAARQAVRESGVVLGSSEPGSVTVGLQSSRSSAPAPEGGAE